MDDSDDEQNKSVICLTEVSDKKMTLVCKNTSCTTPENFEKGGLIVKCQNCHGVYHPRCADMDEMEKWIGFMNSCKNRKNWNYTCEFCKHEVKAIFKVNELLKSISTMIQENHSLMNGKITTLASKVEKMEGNYENQEKSMNVIKINLNKVQSKFEGLPEELTSMKNEIGEISKNSTVCNSKISENNERSKVIEEKINDVKSATSILAEDEKWTKVENKKKKSASFAVVLQTNPDKSVGELKEQMEKNYVSNEINVTKIVTSGKNKIVAMCESLEEQKHFADIAQKKFGGICNVTTPERKNRRIKVLNIEVWAKFEDLSVNEIEKRMKEENIVLAQAKACKVLSFKKARYNGQEINNRIHVFMEVDEDVYEALIKHGKIKYLYQEPKVVDGFTVGRCYNCLSFNHPKKDCNSKVKTCFNCGGDHIRKECKASETICVNCVRANLEIKSGKKLNIKHSVNDLACPCYVRKYNFLMSRFK